MDFFQMLMALINRNMQNVGGQQGGWQNPGFGNIPKQPFQFPQYNSPYTSGFGSGQGDVMGGQGQMSRVLGGPQPNNIPTGQPPLPQMANTGSQNQMLQRYLASQNPQLAMNPPQIDYRNGTRGLFAGNPGQKVNRMGIFSR